MKKTFHFIRVAFLLIVLLGLPGCGGESYSYKSERDTQAGPGLFSGEKEEIVLYENRKSTDSETKPKEGQTPE